MTFLEIEERQIPWSIGRHVAEQNKNIIIVGGTGLYIKAALYDYRFDKEVNNNNYQDLELDELVKMLKSRSEIEIDYSNKRRVIRALEKLDNNSEFNNTGNKPLFIISSTLLLILLYKVSLSVLRPIK